MNLKIGILYWIIQMSSIELRELWKAYVHRMESLGKTQACDEDISMTCWTCSPGSIVNVWFAHSLWLKHIATIEYKKEGKGPILKKVAILKNWESNRNTVRWAIWVSRVLVSKSLPLRFEIFQGKEWGKGSQKPEVGVGGLPHLWKET